MPGYPRSITRSFSIAPRDGETAVFRDQVVCVHSPSPVEPSCLATSVVAVSAGETEIAGTTELSPDRRVLFFRPLRPLVEHAPHTVRVSGLRNALGALPEISSVFTTGSILLSELVTDFD